MANPNEFYSYLLAVRMEHSNYLAYISGEFKKNGMKSDEWMRKVVQMNMFTVCMDVMSRFDPTVTEHMFTASEMDDWMGKINQLLNETFYVDFKQYY